MTFPCSSYNVTSALLPPIVGTMFPPLDLGSLWLIQQMWWYLTSQSRPYEGHSFFCLSVCLPLSLSLSPFLLLRTLILETQPPCFEAAQTSPHGETLWIGPNGEELRPPADSQHQLPGRWVSSLQMIPPPDAVQQRQATLMCCLKFWTTVSIDIINGCFTLLSFGVMCNVAIVKATPSENYSSVLSVVQCWK